MFVKKFNLLNEILYVLNDLSDKYVCEVFNVNILKFVRI